MLSPAPKPDEETKYSAERGWNAGLYRFLYRRHPELASAGLSQNPFRGMGPLFCTARTRWSWSSLVTSWLAIATRHLMSPQRVPPQNILHRHSCCDDPLAEVSHSCVVTGDMGIMSPSLSLCSTNCVACFNSIQLNSFIKKKKRKKKKLIFFKSSHKGQFCGGHGGLVINEVKRTIQQTQHHQQRLWL